MPNFQKYALTIVALAVMCVQFIITPVLADSPLFRRVEISGGINAATLYVFQDRARWTRISDNRVEIPVNVTAEMSRGYVVAYRLGRNLTDGAVRDILLTYFGGEYNNSGTSIGGNIDSQSSVSLTRSVVIDKFSRLNPTDEQAIIARCNSRLGELNSGHSFSYSLPLALHVDSRRRRRPTTPFDINHHDGDYVEFGDFARATATGSVIVRVECTEFGKPRRNTASPSIPPNDGEPPRSGNNANGIPKPSSNQDLNFDHGQMKVRNIKLTLTTFSNAFHEPTPGTKCKQAKLRVTMETNQTGPVSFKLWKRDAGNISNEDVIVGAHHDGGKFFAVHERWVSVDKTTNLEFNARDLVNETIYKETGWEDITLNCTSPGGGGLANPSSDNGQNDPLIKPMVGNFQFIDNSSAAKRNKCKRTAKALVWFDTPNSSNIHYSLDCSVLGSFSGVAQPAKLEDGTYRASKLINIVVQKTTDTTCTLRTVSPGSPKDHAVKSKMFQCIKPAGYDSGIGGVTTTKRPQTKTAPVRIAPKKPRIQVAVCRGGTIKKRKCFCPRGASRKRISRFEYVCKRQRVAKPAKPKKKDAVRTNPRSNKAKLLCVGGKVRRGKCLCRKGKRPQRVSSKRYECLAVAKPSRKKKAVRVNPTKRTKKRALICRGGKVWGNRCRCPRGFKIKKSGNRKFRCFRPAG